MNTKQLLCALTVCSTLASTAALAGNAPLQQVQKKWAECQYSTPDGDEKEQCFHRAIAKTSIYLDREPGNPELTVWLAINKASLAGAQGGLGALSLAKEAKSLLEGVIATSPQTLDGSAYTSLGSLYYKVPGWPIGFGDDDKAEEMLKKSVRDQSKRHRSELFLWRLPCRRRSRQRSESVFDSRNAGDTSP